MAIQIICYSILILGENNIKTKIKKIYNWFIINEKRRVAYWQLQNMTDNQLKDIGITRIDIERLIYRL